MKSETQVGLGVLLFVTGSMFGCVDASQSFSTLQQINLPGWISAISAVILALAAKAGLRTWRRQLIVKRDYDLAVRVLQTMTRSHTMLEHMRTPHGLIVDRDPSEPEIDAEAMSDEHFKYLQTQSRYRVRQRNLAAASDERTAVMRETLDVFEDVELGELIYRLSVMEGRVTKEAAKLIHAVHPNPQGGVQDPDNDVLYSPGAVDAPDAFGEEYKEILEQIRVRLGPKLRME